ncbi:MAG TPA: hypothetical protein VIV60_33915 [Polyangiaceae bacterium]
MRSVPLALFSWLVLPLMITTPGFARESADDEASETSNDESPGKTEGADVRTADEDGTTASKKELDPSEIERAKEAEKANSPVEDPNKSYYFVGVRYRGMVLPKFMMTLFGDGGTSVYINGIGPEFTVRKNNFEYVLSAWWAGYSMPSTRFRAAGDPPDGWEYVKSSLNVMYLTSDFNWTSQITPAFGLNLGLGAGVGLVWGDLNRNEAYQDGSGNWHRCVGPGSQNGADVHGYCNPSSNKDAQYDYNEKSWANGGSKPNVFPWLALQTGVRIKPHRNFMARIDLGWAITGPFFGISGNYGL